MCRRFGQKLGLTPERCASPKCAFTRRSYAPGAHGQNRRRRKKVSEYGQQLSEKQRVRLLYGVSEQALKRSVRNALARVQGPSAASNALDVIAEQLERRLDNVVFRLGFAPSRTIARQYVSHGHVLVNGRRTTSPAYLVRNGEAVAVRPESRTLTAFSGLMTTLPKHKTPDWLSLDVRSMSGTLTAPPMRDDAMMPVDLAKIVEFYAR